MRGGRRGCVWGRKGRWVGAEEPTCVPRIERMKEQCKGVDRWTDAHHNTAECPDAKGPYSPCVIARYVVPSFDAPASSGRWLSR